MFPFIAGSFGTSEHPGFGWQQSRDIVRYIDPTSIADPKTCGHEASQLYSSSEVVFQKSLHRSSPVICSILI